MTLKVVEECMLTVEVIATVKVMVTASDSNRYDSEGDLDIASDLDFDFDKKHDSKLEGNLISSLRVNLKGTGTGTIIHKTLI